MIVNFEKMPDFQPLATDGTELNNLETQVGRPLPQDYRQHMLQYNGGGVVGLVEHKNFPENGDHGLSDFCPIQYGDITVESLIGTNEEFFQSMGLEGYITIGFTNARGDVIMSLKDDSTYGSIQHLFPDGDLEYMSPSFTQYLEDMVQGFDLNNY